MKIQITKSKLQINTKLQNQKKSLKFRILEFWSLFGVWCLVLGALFLVNPTNGFAAQPLEAEVVSQNQTVLRLKPGQSFTVSVRIKNIGTSAWQSAGSSFVALNTADEKIQKTVKSKFQHKSWKKWWRPASIQKLVKSSETTDIKFVVTAPVEIGRFTEKFSLAKAGYGFIDGGDFTLTIISFPQIPVKSTVPESLEIEQGQTRIINVQFENTSKISWDAQKFPLLLSVGDLKSLSSFADSSWTDNQTPCLIAAKSKIKPKQKFSCSITFKAPDTPGSYRETFFVNAKDLGAISSSRFPINFSVLPKIETAAPRFVAGEPIIRVGLFSKNKETQFKANDILDLIDSSGATILTITPSSLIAITPIDAASFSVSAENKTINISSPARFVPRNQTTVSEITTFERRPAWNTTLNDNLFRGTIEFRLLSNSTTYWAIEEVAMEEYLRGIAEVSDSDNPVYLKTMMIAARTYAAFLNIYKTKHKSEGYDINMTTDQVYRGYNLELRAPNTTKAILDTEGQILVHPYAVDEKNPLGIIVASYSSGTDGKTRRWCKVWKCGDPELDYPWAMAIDDPLGIIPNALTLSGNHMVGLSGKGARAMAEQGITFEEILKYYYAGVEIKKIY